MGILHKTTQYYTNNKYIYYSVSSVFELNMPFSRSDKEKVIKRNLVSVREDLEQTPSLTALFLSR